MQSWYGTFEKQRPSTVILPFMFISVISLLFSFSHYFIHTMSLSSLVFQFAVFYKQPVTHLSICSSTMRHSAANKCTEWTQMIWKFPNVYITKLNDVKKGNFHHFSRTSDITRYTIQVQCVPRRWLCKHGSDICFLRDTCHANRCAPSGHCWSYIASSAWYKNFIFFQWYKISFLHAI